MQTATKNKNVISRINVEKIVYITIYNIHKNTETTQAERQIKISLQKIMYTALCGIYHKKYSKNIHVIESRKLVESK